MQGIITDTADIISLTTSTLESQVRYELSALGGELTIKQAHKLLRALIKFLKDQCPNLLMVAITSFDQQLQYCRNHFHLVVSQYS